MRSFSRPEPGPGGRQRSAAAASTSSGRSTTRGDCVQSSFPGRRLAIVGSGFVGTEVASTAVELGVDVTIIDLASLPFERTLGPEVGRLLADRYREHGVALRLGAGVESVLRRSDGTLRGLRLSNGMELEMRPRPRRGGRRARR